MAVEIFRGPDHMAIRTGFVDKWLSPSGDVSCIQIVGLLRSSVGWIALQGGAPLGHVAHPIRSYGTPVSLTL